jgi:hypothetical protein
MVAFKAASAEPSNNANTFLRHFPKPTMLVAANPLLRMTFKAQSRI